MDICKNTDIKDILFKHLNGETFSSSFDSNNNNNNNNNNEDDSNCNNVIKKIETQTGCDGESSNISKRIASSMKKNNDSVKR